MNKNHRVIWSTIRNCFVVASEVAKAKGKPSSTRKTVAAAIAALFIAPGVASAAACGNETNISGAVGAQCYTDQNVIINNTGSITTGPAVTATAAYISAAPYSSNFTNNGTIRVEASATGTYDAYAYGVYVDGAVAGTINNTGLIDVKVSNANDTADAYGIYANGNVDASGSITNSGMIKLDVAANNDPEAYGIYVSGNVAGSVVNSGTIDIKEVGVTSDLYAYGIYVSGDVTGSVTNSGTIKLDLNPLSYIYTGAGIYVSGGLGANASINNTGTITVNAYTDTGYYSGAYGIYVNNDVDGTILNSKTINISSTALSDASAYGVYIGGDLNGKLINSGTITAQAKALTDTSAYAYGVYVSGDLNGKITNSGTITAIADAISNSSSNNAYAYGVSVTGVADGASITNTGTIQATANGGGVTSYGYASAYGISVSGALNGVINNSGTIAATVNATPVDSVYGSAYGIYVNSIGASGSIVNSGTIAASASAYGASYPYAYGIYVSNATAGTISNSGSITATATGETDGYAYGIYLDGDVSGALTNSGTITATATAKTNDYGSAVGVNINGTLSSSLNNSGTISATATGGLNSYASAYGVYANTLTGSIVNSGAISATALGGSASSDNYAYGIYVSNLNGGTITNSGTISGVTKIGLSGDDYGYSIYTSGVGTVNNLAGGVLNGRVDLGGSVNLNNDGLLNTRLAESYVGGNYTQGATGALKISALDDATYGSLTATGTATLAEGATIRVALDPAHTLATGSVLQNVVTGNGGLTMGAVNVQDNSLSLNFTAVNDLANGVDLTATATGLTTVAATVAGAGLGSAVGVGGVLDALLVNPDAQSPQVTSFLYALGGSTTAQQVTNRVAELLPLMSGSVNHATLDTMRMLNLAINQRLDAKAGVASGDLAFNDKHFWLKPFGSWASQDKRNGTLGYDADTYGLAFGADGQISDANTVGLAISYARTDMDSDMIRQNADIDSYQAAFYGTHKFSDATSLNYQADFGYHDNSGRRSITGIGSAKSDYDSWSGHVGASLAHTIAIDDVTTFTPSIRADYSRIRAESYREKGAGAFNLNVGSETTDELILGADGKLARSISDKATAFANLGVGYDVINERTSMTSSFAGVPGAVFATRGIDPSPWLVRGGLGIVGQATETLELSLRYDFEVRNDFDNQTASVKARWAF